MQEKTTTILYIITKSVWAGAGKYTYDLATNLPQTSLPADKVGLPAQARFRSIVAAGGNGELARKIKDADIPYFEIKNFQRNVNVFKEFFAFFEILSLLYTTKPDIIHVSSAKAGGVAGVAAFVYKYSKKLAAKLLKDGHNGKSSATLPQVFFSIHGWTFNESRPKWQIFLIKFFSRLTCLFYDKIICVSEYDYKIGLQNKIASAKKMTIIHNGIKPENYNFLPREKARESLRSRTPKSDLGVRLLIIGTIGEFTKNKGQEYLINALKSVVNDEYPVISILIGFDGGEKNNLESKIRKLKLENKVFLIENLPYAANYLKAFDIFVLPSLKEGLPYVLLEAGLAEIPIIATNVGGIPEIIHPALSMSDLENLKRSDIKETGVLVMPANTEQLTDSIKKLIENQNLRTNLTINARQKILRDFSFEKMLTNTLALYE